jgi:hypothetical protein
MPNRGDYHHDLDRFLKEQERLAQDAAFQEKVDRLAGFMNCDGRDVLRILRQEGEIPVVVFQRFPDQWPTGNTDIERVESAIALIDLDRR